MIVNLNDKIFIKKEKQIYKNYRLKNYSVKFSSFKAFHDTINFFKNNDYKLGY
jgi:hypothetical protein